VRFEFKLPDIGEGVAEGEVVAWLVGEGDSVEEDQPMVEVMTDKATVTIGTPKAGKIAELRAKLGARVQVGEVLVVIQTGNGVATDADARRAHGRQPTSASRPLPTAPAATQTAASAVGDIRESLPGANFFARKAAEPPAAKPTSTRTAPQPEHKRLSRPSTSPRDAQVPRAQDERTPLLSPPPSAAEPGADSPSPQRKPSATPATRKLARDLGLDLRSVVATGPKGRITKHDVHTAAAAPHAHSTQRPPQTDPTQRPPTPSARADTRVPFVGLRRRIAERMQQAKLTAAHFTFVEECDASQLLSLRERLKPAAAQRGIDLTFLPFAIKAVCCALKKNPMLNASLDTEHNELVLHGRCHIGIAVATDQGLLVPVIHDADSMDLFALAREVQRLGDAARAGQLTAAELSGATFTLTSLGKRAGLLATPILNLPNVGILGIHRIKEKPVVRNGQIEIGHIMLLSLSFDHRIVDGHVGAAFAYDVIEYLEEPTLMLAGA